MSGVMTSTNHVLTWNIYSWDFHPHAKEGITCCGAHNMKEKIKNVLPKRQRLFLFHLPTKKMTIWVNWDFKRESQQKFSKAVNMADSHGMNETCPVLIRGHAVQASSLPVSTGEHWVKRKLRPACTLRPPVFCDVCADASFCKIKQSAVWC